MDKETLRMQMLSGVITESEYKAKLEEGIYDLTSFHKGSHSTGRPDFNKMTADEIEDYLEKDKDNPGGLYGRSLSIVKYILDKKRKEETEKDSLNEHFVAGGIVGIGAINQIPSRAKADYEDAFEYFLSQKYSLNEADEATAVGEKVEAAVEDKLETTVNNLSDEQKAQLRAELAKAGITADSRIEDVAGKLDESLTEAEGDTKTKVANVLSAVGGGLMKSLLVPIIPLIVGKITGTGFIGGTAITAGTAGALIGLAKLLDDEKSMEEGKDIEENIHNTAQMGGILGGRNFSAEAEEDKKAAFEIEDLIQSGEPKEEAIKKISNKYRLQPSYLSRKYNLYVLKGKKEVEELDLYEAEVNENVGSTLEKILQTFEFSEKGNDEMIEFANYLLSPEGPKNIAMSIKSRLKGEGGENYFTSTPDELNALLSKLK